jgi:hypothetical protein
MKVYVSNCDAVNTISIELVLGVLGSSAHYVSFVKRVNRYGALGGEETNKFKHAGFLPDKVVTFQATEWPGTELRSLPGRPAESVSLYLGKLSIEYRQKLSSCSALILDLLPYEDFTVYDRELKPLFISITHECDAFFLMWGENKTNKIPSGADLLDIDPEHNFLAIARNATKLLQGFK